MSDYEFTTDWFHLAPPVWQTLIPLLPSRKKFLEIGSYEGRSTVWTIENMMDEGGVIHCVDIWDDRAIKKRFDSNVSKAAKKYAKKDYLPHKGKSSVYLSFLNYVAEKFDFIFIDGSHEARDVLTDACMAWPLLRDRGIMVFDDYNWRPDGHSVIHRPKIAIDAFSSIFDEELRIIHIGYQFVVQKTGA